MSNFTMTHSRKLNHYVELHKGDTLELIYKGEPSRRELASSYYVKLSANHREMYEDMLEHSQATNLINLFGRVEVDTPSTNSKKEFLELLELVVSDKTIKYKNIYS